MKLLQKGMRGMVQPQIFLVDNVAVYLFLVGQDQRPLPDLWRFLHSLLENLHTLRGDR